MGARYRAAAAGIMTAMRPRLPDGSRLPSHVRCFETLTVRNMVARAAFESRDVRDLFASDGDGAAADRRAFVQGLAETIRDKGFLGWVDEDDVIEAARGVGE